MYIKAKLGKWGFIPSLLVIAILFSFVYYLKVPFILNYSDTAKVPPYEGIVFIAVIAAFVSSFLSSVAQSLLSFYRTVDDNEKIALKVSDLFKAKTFWVWTGVWVVVYGALLISAISEL